MEADNHFTVDGFEHIETETRMDGQMLKQQMDNEIVILRCEFRAEIDAIKSENKVLLAKLDSFQAQNGELKANNRDMQARLETMEQKLKIAELETKLAKQEIGDLFEVKVNGAIGQLREEFNKHAGEQKNNLVATSVNKIWEFHPKLEKTQNLSIWSNNHWHISDSYKKHVQASADGLSIKKTANWTNVRWTNIRAQQPVSRAMLLTFTGLKLFYWEVHMKNIREYPGSYAISCLGNYWKSGKKVEGYGKGFAEGDIVGSGYTRDGRLFFTKNGALNGEPIILKKSQNLLLYPAVSLYSKGIEVKANFGANPEKEPFAFDIHTYQGQLSNEI